MFYLCYVVILLFWKGNNLVSVSQNIEKYKIEPPENNERKRSNNIHIDEPGLIGTAYEFQNVVFTNELSNYTELY